MFYSPAKVIVPLVFGKNASAMKHSHPVLAQNHPAKSFAPLAFFKNTPAME
jgi:hypothetical protein